MSTIRNAVLGLLVAGVSLGAAAQTAAEHEQHHPGGTPAATTAKAAPAPQTMDPAQMANREQQMKAMQAMHEKMAAAKTPKQRQALMAEHMKLMQEGMTMMKQMGADMKGMGGMSGDKGMMGNMDNCHQMMGAHMGMMHAMMQMMMDRLPPAPAAQ